LPLRPKNFFDLILRLLASAQINQKTDIHPRFLAAFCQFGLSKLLIESHRYKQAGSVCNTSISFQGPFSRWLNNEASLVTLVQKPLPPFSLNSV